MREHIAALLMDAFGAASYEWNTRLSESVLARLHYVLHVDPAAPRDGRRSARSKQRVVAAARAWLDDLRDALVAARGEEAGLDAYRIWADAFPGAYQDDFDAAEAHRRPRRSSSR